MNDTEEWRPVVGYEGIYEVSNLGRVRKTNTSVLITPQNRYDGYVAIRLSCGGKRFGFLAHRLVALAFISNPENKPEVNHKDGTRDNNKSLNLEWATRLENVHHTGLVLRRWVVGSKNSKAKLTESDIPDILAARARGMSYAKIAAIYKMNTSLIRGIVLGKRWKHATRKTPDIFHL